MGREFRDYDEDEGPFLTEYGVSLAGLRSAECPAPRMLPALEEGLLPEETARQVASHLENCAACRLLASRLAALPPPEPSDSTRQRVLARVLSAAEADESRQPAPAPRRVWWWALVPASALAALLLFIVPTGWREKPAATPPISGLADRVKAELAALATVEKAPVELPLDALLALRSDPAPYYQALVAALVPYKDGKLDDAAAELERVARLYPKGAEAHFYQGVSELLLGRTDQAIRALKSAESLSEGNLQRNSAWYLAQACLKAGDAETAAGYLSPLCAAGEAGPGKQACELLDKLARVRGRDRR